MKALLVILLVVIVAGGVFLYYPRATGTDATSAATLGVLNGAVDAQRGGGDFAPALDGDVIASGDTVRANPTGRATITFFDASSITVEPGAVVKVVSVSRTGSGGLNTVIEQSLGKTWASVEKLKGDGRFEIRTPSTTAVVRGTAFIVEVAADGSTIVRTTEGEVIVQAQGQQRSVTGGNQNTTTLGQPPSAPAPQPAGPKLRLLSQLNGLGYVIIDPAGRTCGANGGQQVRQIPGCNVTLGGTGPGSEQVDSGEVVAGTYTALMTTSAPLTGINLALSGGAAIDAPDARGQFGDAAGIRPGEIVSTRFDVALAGARVSLTPFAPAERIASVCGADVRGRLFNTGSLAKRSAALVAYARTAPGQPAALVLTDAELTAAAQVGAVMPADSPARVSDISVVVNPAGVYLKANVSAGPIAVRGGADVVAGAAGGKLTMRVRGLDAGLIPSAIKDQLTKTVETALDEFTSSFPLTVDRVALRPGCLAIIGRTK